MKSGIRLNILVIYTILTFLFVQSLTIYANTYVSETTVSNQETATPNDDEQKKPIRPKIKSTIKSITLNRNLIRLNKGDKRTVNAFFVDKKREGIEWFSRNPKIARVSKKGVVIGKRNGTTYIICRSKSGKVKAQCKVVVKNTKYAAFTFDDGPGDYTDKLLDSLEKYNYHATFFVVGNRVNRFKSELKKAYTLHNEIGSHSYDHSKLTDISKLELEKEISKTNSNIEKIIGTTPTLLRPPYGSHNNTVDKAAGVPIVLWSVDTLDWKYRNTNYVYKEILKSVDDGEIILLHDIHETSVNGFVKALPKLRKKGYELVTVSELYKIRGKSIKAGKSYYSCYK